MTDVAAPIARASANDLLQTAFARWPASSQVGALLILDSRTLPDLDVIRSAVEHRIRAVPRMRQRLHKTPPGCGRPVWVDDAGFDVAAHVTETVCPGDERALLELTAATAAVPLPPERPLWAALVVRGVAAERTALILTFHHVLADGIGGLAVLAQLVDGLASGPEITLFPRPAPTRWQLAVDAVRSRARAVRRLPAALRRLRAAAGQLRPARTGRVAPCSLLRPTGPRRRLAVARADLAAVKATAHAHGATVNDVVLTAVTGALHAFLRERGEHLERAVVSVPVSGHPAGEGPPAGNQVGVIPLSLPASGPASARLEEIAQATTVLRSGRRGASAALLEPVFRALSALGLVQRYINRQRRVHTFVTNLRGPAERLSFLGATVEEIIPVNATAGNVAVSFGVLSYAGRLTVTVVADPDACPELDALCAALQQQLDVLVTGPATAPPGPGSIGPRRADPVLVDLTRPLREGLG
jgi:diacylglycerol O-acyltransferase / wax synthase